MSPDVVHNVIAATCDPVSNLKLAVHPLSRCPCQFDCLLATAAASFIPLLPITGLPMSEEAADGAVASYRAARTRAFAYPREADLVHGLELAALGAVLTGVAAQVSIPLPFTPVPITLQTFAVLLTGVTLGARFGGASQALYVGLGAGGVPWFEGFGAGVGALAGPTGGYLVGFPVAAVLAGAAVDRYPVTRRLPVLLVVLGLANAVVFAFGLPWLYTWLTVINGDPLSLPELANKGLIPFIPGGIMKTVGAALVATAFLPGPSERS
ncbi:MAG: hypothetical protein J07HX5_01066 [halophilic archaeon J07HX5]|nr:MAG: hypothetical protein J07HX5_01066 [halophilic archaeon J07HX5]